MKDKWRTAHPDWAREYGRTFKGFFNNTYGRMCWRIKTSKAYQGLEIMSRHQWISFKADTEDVRRILWQAWKDSGHQLRLAPSIDRIDLTKGYVRGNCRWITQGQNSAGSRTKWKPSKKGE